MNGIKNTLFALMITVLLLASCQLGAPTTPTAAPAVQVDASPTIQPTDAPTPQPIVLNPLTGLPVADPALLERMPIMVKVSNFPREGRPHAGLSFADIVFDYYIGYGTNRFLAIFYGNDSPSIGPVRSGRLVDAQLVRLYQGILGYGSADEDTDAYLVQALGERIGRASCRERV